METCSVSVIIPAWRAARTIERAVDSVLAQTLPAAEILVINDGSPDNLLDVLARYQAPVRVISQPNGGVASARNRGMQEARGELIAFLDADDFWEPTKLEQQVALYRQHPDLGLTCSYFHAQMPDGSERELCRWTNSPWNNQPPLDRKLSVRGAQAFELATQIWTGTVMFPRRLVGESRFEARMTPAEDRHFWLQLIQKAPVYYLSATTAVLVLEPDSLSRSSVDRDCSQMIELIRDSRPCLQDSGVRAWERIVYRNWAGRLLYEGQHRDALRPGFQRWKRDLFSPEAWWVLLKAGTGSLFARRRLNPAT